MPNKTLPKLIVDDREPIGQERIGKRGQHYNAQDIRPLLTQQGLEIETETLIAGDYKWFWEDVPHFVTRKASDFAESMYTGHLSNEVAKMFDEALPESTIWFLQEGEWVLHPEGIGYLKRVSPNAARVTHTTRTSLTNLIHEQISVNTAGLRYIQTADLSGTAIALAALVDRCTRGWPSSMGTPVPRTYKTKDPKIGHLMTLWPRLPFVVAELLLQDYGSIRAIIDSAHHSDFLLEYKGIGPRGLENFRGVIG